MIKINYIRLFFASTVPFFKSSNKRRLTAMEGLEDRLGLWLRRMSTAPTTSESMATNKASVAYTETNQTAGYMPKHNTQQQ